MTEQHDPAEPVGRDEVSRDEPPVLPDRSPDDTDDGWGERRSGEDRDDDWYERERPPHW